MGLFLKPTKPYSAKIRLISNKKNMNFCIKLIFSGHICYRQLEGPATGDQVQDPGSRAELGRFRPVLAVLHDNDESGQPDNGTTSHRTDQLALHNWPHKQPAHFHRRRMRSAHHCCCSAFCLPVPKNGRDSVSAIVETTNERRASAGADSKPAQRNFDR